MRCSSGMLLCLPLAVAGLGFGAPRAATLAKLPLSFERNQGQTNPAVKFLSRGDGYVLFLTADSAVFKLPASVVRMRLCSGANPNPKVSGAEALPGKVNYFIGNDPQNWISGASTYGRVNYEQVYQGIDLVFYGSDRQLEYDFLVAPGADPASIVLEFAGPQPRLAADGALTLTADGPLTADGATLSFARPAVYQIVDGKQQMIAGDYRLTEDRRLHFALGNYDHTRALVIDPVLSYLTYVGGSGNDQVGNTTYGSNPTQGGVADAAGNVYVTGYTQSTDFPVANAIQGVSTANGFQGFIFKMNPAGSQLIYSTYIGGSLLGDGTGTEGYAIAADSSGNAYITGFTNSPKFPVTAGVYQTACGFVGASGMSNCPGAQSAFLTKLNPTGGLVYSTFFGHSNETGKAIAVDSFSGPRHISRAIPA